MACVPVKVRLRFDGVNVPDKIALNIQYVLDAKKEKNKRRMFFLDSQGTSERSTVRNRDIEIFRDRPWSEEFKVYLPTTPEVKDKLTSLDIQVLLGLSI